MMVCVHQQKLAYMAASLQTCAWLRQTSFIQLLAWRNLKSALPSHQAIKQGVLIKGPLCHTCILTNLEHSSSNAAYAALLIMIKACPLYRPISTHNTYTLHAWYAYITYLSYVSYHLMSSMHAM